MKEEETKVLAKKVLANKVELINITLKQIEEQLNGIIDYEICFDYNITTSILDKFESKSHAIELILKEKI